MLRLGFDYTPNRGRVTHHGRPWKEQYFGCARTWVMPLTSKRVKGIKGIGGGRGEGVLGNKGLCAGEEERESKRYDASHTASLAFRHSSSEKKEEECRKQA